MTLHKPYMMQPASGDPDLTYTGAEMRLLSSMMFPFQGVVHPTADSLSSFQVTQRGAGANFSVDIAAGMAAILGADVANQNMYGVWSDATYNLTTPGAPASGTRLHRVVIQLRDKLNNGTWTGYDFIPVLVQDTGAGFPAEPLSALTIAQVQIAAAQASVTNSNIVDMRPPAGTRTRRKAADLTRTATGATADPDLTTWLDIGAYEVESYLQALGATGTPDFSFGLQFSGTATGSWGGVVNKGGSTGFQSIGHNSWTSSGQDSMACHDPSNDNSVLLTGTITTTTTGTLFVNWAPNASGGSLILRKGSRLKVRRIV